MAQEYPITELLRAAGTGDHEAKRRLFALVYEQLKAIAHRRMENKHAVHTWQTTDLVHEWLVKVLRTPAFPHIEDRRHLTNAASVAMRNLLVDHAKKRGRVKRGGEASRIPLDGVLDTIERRGLDLTELRDSVESLRQQYPLHAEIFEQNFFGGFTTEEIAEAHRLSIRTIQGHLAFAKARLRLHAEDA